MRRDFLHLGLLIVLFCGCGNSSLAYTPPLPVYLAVADPVLAARKAVLRNNAASLLLQLVQDEQNAAVLLIVKGNRADIATLVKAISATAEEACKNLTALAASDPSLNFHAINLPPAEVAARAAIAKSKTYELLFSTGATFEFDLLLSQADALSYGYNLAQIAADNSTDPVQQKIFSTLSNTMKAQFQQVIALMRGPAK